ncbi:MAG: restriction endonuclease subunit S [Planctomycetota bacterium]|nr:restriction endonuclease subunit S [Planctomycetota bacterium]
MRTSTEQEEEVEREGNGAPTVSFPFTADPMVPSEPTRPGWCWHRLTTLARLATGHTPSRRCPEYWSGDIPWLQLSDIRALDGRRALDTLEHINELGINNSAAMLLPEGTVCLSRTASVGFVTVMGRPMATSQDFVNWVCGPDLSPEFLKWLFIACRKPIRDLGSGAVHQTIYFPTVEQFAVCIPPLAEQERIAGRLTEQLGAVERGRAAAEQRLAAAEALPAALLREVFEGPQASGWETVRLGNLLHRHNEIIHPGDRKSGEAVFVGLEHIESHSGRRIGSGKVEFASMTGRKPTFQRGHIVYGYLRPYLNKVWVADFDGCSSVDQFAFDVNPELADTTFVAAFMRSATFLRRAKGVTTTGQLPRISIDEIAAVDIELPPDLPTQRRLAAELTQKLAAAEGVIARCGEGLAAIEALPAALLRQAIGHGVDPETAG